MEFTKPEPSAPSEKYPIHRRKLEYTNGGYHKLYLLNSLRINIYGKTRILLYP